MGNRNQGNGRLRVETGLNQLGPSKSTGNNGYQRLIVKSSEAASKLKSLGTRVNMSVAKRKKLVVTLPKFNLDD